MTVLTYMHGLSSFLFFFFFLFFWLLRLLLNCEQHPEAEKLYLETVDVGEAGELLCCVVDSSVLIVKLIEVTFLPSDSVFRMRVPSSASPLKTTAYRATFSVSCHVIVD